MQPLEVFEVDPPAIPDQPPVPRAFRWHGQEFRVVAVLRRWQDEPARARGALRSREMRFGSPARTAEGRTYFRVRTGDGSVFDVAYDPHPGNWVLLRQLAASSRG